ncbi:MAG: TAXI family TRAP transporter solute-binding subunit [Deltaproteobacteria bacterium]|jgi:TRAP transporter TAXI family solute receptor|nr:TAXI family TRAP transporter solute-binding subunit [Deltaproteobacteria bacterium]
MKKSFFALTALALTLALISLAHSSQAISQRDGQQSIILGVGGVTGVYYQVGGEICRLLEKGRRAKEHNIKCSIESTRASVFNVTAVRSRKMDVGLAQSDIQYYAYYGKERFKNVGPDNNLRSLFSLQSEIFTLVARADARIETFDDLAGKRMNLGNPGSGNRATLELLMKEYGWTPRVFKFTTELYSAQMAGALCDNKIDAYVYVVGHPNSAIQEAANSCPSHVVSVTGDTVKAFIEKYPFYPEAVIPGGLYKGTPEPVISFGPRATLVTNDILPDEVAYHITKAVFGNFKEFQAIHPALNSLTPKSTLEANSAPIHPGAKKYFQQAGLMK